MTLEELAELFDLAVKGNGIMDDVNVFESLEVQHLVERVGELWYLTARGESFVEFVRLLPLPEETRAWQMPQPVVPKSKRPVHPEGGVYGFHDNNPPAPVVAIEPEIPTDPEQVRNLARQLLDASWGQSEIASKLKIPEAEVERIFMEGRQ